MSVARSSRLCAFLAVMDEEAARHAMTEMSTEIFCVCGLCDFVCGSSRFESVLKTLSVFPSAR